MKFLVLMLAALLVGCASGQKSVFSDQYSVGSNQRSVISPPPLPRAHKSTTPSLHQSSASAAAAPAPTRTVTLIWNKNDPSPDTFAEIWSAPTPAGPFTLRATASGETITLPHTGPQEFFIIRNRNGDLVSDWSRNQP